MSDLDGSPPHPDARHLHGRQAAAQAASSNIHISDISCGCDLVKAKGCFFRQCSHSWMAEAGLGSITRPDPDGDVLVAARSG
jgi:hypothetical protein